MLPRIPLTRVRICGASPFITAAPHRKFNSAQRVFNIYVPKLPKY